MEQTHFIGVRIPKDLEIILSDCRNYMKRTYGCRSGHRTPFHVTLIPPFCLPEEYCTEDIIEAVDGISFSFTARVDGFGSFGERTLFANIVGDRKWEELRDMVFKAVNEEIPGVLRKDRKPFRPHISISNRDIPQGAVYEALRVFSSIQMKFDFEVDGITVFERSSSGLWLC